MSATVGQRQWFSKEALATRKTIEGFPPERLDQYIAKAWEPSSEELWQLKKELATHQAFQ